MEINTLHSTSNEIFSPFRPRTENSERFKCFMAHAAVDQMWSKIDDKVSVKVDLKDVEEDLHKSRRKTPFGKDVFQNYEKHIDRMKCLLLEQREWSLVPVQNVAAVLFKDESEFHLLRINPLEYGHKINSELFETLRKESLSTYDREDLFYLWKPFFLIIHFALEYSLTESKTVEELFQSNYSFALFALEFQIIEGLKLEESSLSAEERAKQRRKLEPVWREMNKILSEIYQSPLKLKHFPSGFYSPSRLEKGI